MGRTGIMIALAGAVALGSACSDTADRREARQEAALAVGDKISGEDITVRGCLTSASDRGAFAVTAARDVLVSGALYAGDGEVPTYTYELVGNAADLSQHVGRQVEVSGTLDDARDDEVVVDQEEETTLEPRQSGDEKVTPAIETEIEAEINVRRLHVSTVTPTGQPCLPERQ